MIKRIFLLLFLFVSINGAKAQLKYIGLKDEANLLEAKEFLWDHYKSQKYTTNMHIFQYYLYVTTVNGIYRKNLATLNDTLWKHYAFEGIPIRNFVKDGNRILAATGAHQDHLLLLFSDDDGKTYKDVTPPFFLQEKYENKASVYNIASNPLNPNSILISAYPLPIAKSTDFGKNWTVLGGTLGGYQDWFVGFHPSDTTALFNTGEFHYFDSFISASYNNGKSWETVETIQNHCTHELVFHPNNSNIIISGGEGRIAKSYDKGKTWNNTNTDSSVRLYGDYIYSIVYDENNLDILYAGGSENDSYDNFRIYRSTDGGDSWHLYIDEKVENSRGLIDLKFYQNKLIIQTKINGIYFLDLSESTGIVSPEKKQTILYPNPVQHILNVKCNTIPKNIKLLSITGSLLFSQNPKSHDFEVNMTSYAKGVYLLCITYENGVETETIFKV